MDIHTVMSHESGSITSRGCTPSPFRLAMLKGRFPLSLLELGRFSVNQIYIIRPSYGRSKIDSTHQQVPWQGVCEVAT